MPTRLSLVGRGLDPVQTEARQRGLEVEVHGYLDDPWSVAEGAWAYVHPAVHEGLPLAVIEAMMRGLPVIASRIGGNPEAVEDGETGLLVPPGDARALAEVLARILRDRPLRDRMGAAGRRRAVERFEASTSLDAYLRLYGEVGRVRGDGV